VRAHRHPRSVDDSLASGLWSAGTSYVSPPSGSNAEAVRVFQKSLKNVVTPADNVDAGDAAVMPGATPKSQDTERFGVELAARRN
jgi:hypothetical protein